MSILDFVPKGWTPREQQKQALLWFEENYDKKDVFCFAAPVAVGKSLISMTISAWVASKKNNATVLTPSVILQDQYGKDFKDIANVKGAERFSCKEDPEDTCGMREPEDRCYKCPYNIARDRAKTEPQSLMNFWTYLQQDAAKHRNVILVDESHNLLTFFVDLRTVEMSQSKYQFPDKIDNIGDVTQFLEKAHNKLLGEVDEMKKDRAETQEYVRIQEIAKEQSDITREQKLEFRKSYMAAKQRLKAKTTEYNLARKQLRQMYVCSQDMKREKNNYHFRIEARAKDKYLIVKPLSSTSNNSKFWPERDKNLKIVMLSATFDLQDIKELGLYSDYRVGFFECESPIEKKRRYNISWGTVNMAYKNREENIPKLAETIKVLQQKHRKYKGLVHVTYGLAEELQYFFKDDPMVMFHTKSNKSKVYKEFLESDEPRVLMASGMSEGIDLSGSKGRWQVITQIPRLLWADEYVQAKAKKYPTWYDREAVRTIQQMSGRICRSPDDYGLTYIVDSRFKKFYEKNEKHFNKWFKEALIFQY